MVSFEMPSFVILPCRSTVNSVLYVADVGVRHHSAVAWSALRYWSQIRSGAFPLMLLSPSTLRDVRFMSSLVRRQRGVFCMLPPTLRRNVRIAMPSPTHFLAEELSL